jgi:uncharacterized protein (UPF0276 family)
VPPPNTGPGCARSARPAAAPPALAGIGLKPAHWPGLQAAAAAVDFLEVHAENFMGAGGPMHRLLDAARERWPLSVHGVGLSIGGASLDAGHLARLAALVRRTAPAWVSEHLAWSSHGGTALNDLLPLPYDNATLRRVCRHVQQVQEALGRRLLLENPSTYVEFTASSWSEADFLIEVVRRTGCGLLLDVNNAYVSAVNHHREAWALIGGLLASPVGAAAIGEIHLAGFAEDLDGAGDRLLIDDHGAAVDAAVWRLYRRTIAQLGAVPTLIERDNDLPPLEVLALEAARARWAQSEVPGGIAHERPRELPHEAAPRGRHGAGATA